MCVHADGVTFLGSGALGLPTLEALHRAGLVLRVISQPDRPAGRGRMPTATPVAAWAAAHGLPLMRTDDVNHGEAFEAVRGGDQPLVVIAFGQRIGPALLQDRLSVNLHPSDLPRWRGAAPIQRAMMAGEERIGVCAIRVVDRMDAGEVLDRFETHVGESETAGEVLDRVAADAVPMMSGVVRRLLAGERWGVPQDESRASRAAKLSKAEAWVDLAWMAHDVRLRVNGLQPWPGCVVHVGDREVRWLRASIALGQGRPGEILRDGAVACGQGAVLPLEAQEPGGRPVRWSEWLRGRRIPQGACVQSGPRGAQPA
jgi:methionyl-tRNA formyltransferase